MPASNSSRSPPCGSRASSATGCTPASTNGSGSSQRPTSDAMAQTSAMPSPRPAVVLRHQDRQPAELGQLAPGGAVEAAARLLERAHALALVAGRQHVTRAVAEHADRIVLAHRQITLLLRNDWSCASSMSSTSLSTSSVCWPSTGGARRYSTGVAEKRTGLATCGTLPAEACGCSHQHLAVPDLRIVEDLGKTVDGAARNAGGIEVRIPLAHGALADDVLQRRDQLQPVLRAQRVGGEALVGGQFGPAEHLAEGRELRIVAHRHDDLAVGAHRTTATGR